jgi:hypothetical protein
MTGTEYFVFLTEECKVVLNNEELIGTTEYLTLYTRCRVNRCRCNRIRLYVCVCVCVCRSRESAVGIATRYGLDGPGIESRWGGKIFRTRPDRPWGLPSFRFPGVKRPGRGVDHPPRLAPRLKKE